MARNRTIKPEFWSSKALNSISIESNLFFISIWNFADDFGMILNNNRYLLGNCFPFREDVTEKHIDKWKKELIDKKLLTIFEHNGQSILFVTNWEEHQKVVNRSKRNMLGFYESDQEVINAIECLNSNSIDTMFPISNKQYTNNKEQVAKKQIDKTPYKDLTEIYNQKCTKLKKINSLTESRKKNLKKLFKHFGNDINAITDYFDFSNKIPFLIGDNDRNWIANFDFIVNVNKAIVILEGKYGDPIFSDQLNNSHTETKEEKESRLRHERVMQIAREEGIDC